ILRGVRQQQDEPGRFSICSRQAAVVLDGINNSGLGKVWFAGRGIAPSWQMKRDMLSPAYTTRWRDIPVARIG
ncbi:DUF4113 domain-containing protein, partial [Klebsiella pneumoniae]